MFRGQTFINTKRCYLCCFLERIQCGVLLDFFSLINPISKFKCRVTNEISVAVGVYVRILILQKHKLIIIENEIFWW